MLPCSYLCLFLGLLLIGIGEGSNIAARQSQQPNLLSALQNAAKVECTDPTFHDSDEIDPGAQWVAAGAQDLWDALIWDFRQSGHKKYSEIDKYIASTLSVDDSSFLCSIPGNACAGYGPAAPKCDQTFGPAQNMILNSLSWINNYYSPINNSLTKAETDILADVTKLTQNFVSYNKPQMQAADILSGLAEVLFPVGAGQFIANGIRKTVVPLASDAMKAAKGASATSQYYLGKMNDYKVIANQMGFEFSAQAEAVLAGGKNPVDSAAAIIEEIADFDDLVGKVTDNWASSTSNALGSIFSGTTSTDVVTNGISDFAALTNAVRDGKFSRQLALGDTVGAAKTALFSQLLPLALHQNEKVRPVLIIRPYACGDKSRTSLDTLFNELYLDPRNSKYSQSSVSLPQYPGLCFFFLDSNEDGAGQRRKGDAEQPRPLTTLSGFTQGILNGNDYGGITMAEYAESLYTAWLANNKANGIPTYKVDPAAAGGSLGNLFDNPFNSPGLYNSFFNVCGNDVPGSDLKHDPDDMKLVSNNILSAQDWKWADASQGYPCRAHPPRGF